MVKARIMMTETIATISIEKDRGEFFVEVYESVFPTVARFVAERGGSLEDAKDIFHDALVLLYELITNGKANVSSSHEAYLAGIAKHLWIKKFRKDHNKILLNEFESTITIPDDFYGSKNDKLLTLLELTGKKCLDLLRAFYYDKSSLEEISASFHFSGIRSATVQKFKCIEKLREQVKDRNFTYEDLAE